MQPVHITDNAALAEVAHALAKRDSIALDTESDSVITEDANVRADMAIFVISR